MLGKDERGRELLEKRPANGRSIDRRNQHALLAMSCAELSRTMSTGSVKEPYGHGFDISLPKHEGRPESTNWEVLNIRAWSFQ